MSSAHPLRSSALVLAVYRAMEGELILRFADGECRVYSGVPSAVAAGLLSTGSPTLYVRQHLAGAFDEAELPESAVDELLKSETLSSAKGFVISFDSGTEVPGNGRAHPH